jgi:hypothetical protein
MERDGEIVVPKNPVDIITSIQVSNVSPVESLGGRGREMERLLYPRTLSTSSPALIELRTTFLLESHWRVLQAFVLMVCRQDPCGVRESLTRGSGIISDDVFIAG